MKILKNLFFLYVKIVLTYALIQCALYLVFWLLFLTFIIDNILAISPEIRTVLINVVGNNLWIVSVIISLPIGWVLLEHLDMYINRFLKIKKKHDILFKSFKTQHP